MRDIDALSGLVEEFVNRMIRPEAGQFRLEVTTFRIILDRASRKNPVLMKVTITEKGGLVHDLEDNEVSLRALGSFLQRSMDFITSLIGEEVAHDLVGDFIKENSNYINDNICGRDGIVGSLQGPLKDDILTHCSAHRQLGDHDDIIRSFTEVFNGLIKDLGKQTDMSAFRLKLGILREDNRLLRHMDLRKNNQIEIDGDAWSKASDAEVGEALLSTFNSLVGLSTFLMGKEEAMRKGTQMILGSFEGNEELLARYIDIEAVLEGALSRKVSTGLAELDRRMAGGIPKGSSILLISPQGVERDVFINNMISKMIELGGSLLYISARDPPRSVRSSLRMYGLDPDKLEEASRVRMVDWFSWRGERIIGVERDGFALKSSKILSNLSIAIGKASRELQFANQQIAFVNIIPAALNIFDFQQVYNLIQRLRAKFKDEGFASVFVVEKGSVDPESLSRLMDVFDGCMELRRKESANTVLREVQVLSLSGVDFDHRPVRLNMEKGRLIEVPDGTGTGVRGSAARTRALLQTRSGTGTAETLNLGSDGKVILAPPVRMRPTARRRVASKDDAKAKPVLRRRILLPEVPDRVEPTPQRMLDDAMSTIEELLGEKKADSATKVKRVLVRRKR